MSSSKGEKGEKELMDALAPQVVANANYQSTEPRTVVDQAPKDRYYIVKLTMYLFGITSLLPWNFFIQANDYWMFKFRNTTVETGFDSTQANKTDLQTKFASYLSIASKVPYVLFLLVNAYVSMRFQASKRIQWPLSAMILLFLITTAIVFVNTDDSQTTFFAVTITIVVAINAMCGFVQGGATGIAGSLPKKYMGYNVNGMALGGLLASLAQILSLVGDSKPTTSAFFYFATATVFLVINFVCFRLTLRSELYNYYMSKQTSMMKGKVAIREEEVQGVSHWFILKQIWVYAIIIVLIFWVSISVLPAVVVLVGSTSSEKSIWTGRLFLPLACFLLFNVADFVSRLVAIRIPIPRKLRYVTLGVSVLRFVFVPLFMLCNAHPRSHLPVLFGDVDFMFLTLFLAFTGGYLTTIALVQGPKEVKEEHNEQAGSQMAFFLGLGLMLGSISSYALVELL